MKYTLSQKYPRSSPPDQDSCMSSTPDYQCTSHTILLNLPWQGINWLYSGSQLAAVLSASSSSRVHVITKSTGGPLPISHVSVGLYRYANTKSEIRSLINSMLSCVPHPLNSNKHIKSEKQTLLSIA